MLNFFSSLKASGLTLLLWKSLMQSLPGLWFVHKGASVSKLAWNVLLSLGGSFHQIPPPPPPTPFPPSQPPLSFLRVVSKFKSAPLTSLSFSLTVSAQGEKQVFGVWRRRQYFSENPSIAEPNAKIWKTSGFHWRQHNRYNQNPSPKDRLISNILTERKM